MIIEVTNTDPDSRANHRAMLLYSRAALLLVMLASGLGGIYLLHQGLVDFELMLLLGEAAVAALAVLLWLIARHRPFHSSSLTRLSMVAALGALGFGWGLLAALLTDLSIPQAGEWWRWILLAAPLVMVGLIAVDRLAAGLFGVLTLMPLWIGWPPAVATITSPPLGVLIYGTLLLVAASAGYFSQIHLLFLLGEVGNLRQRLTQAAMDKAQLQKQLASQGEHKEHADQALSAALEAAESANLAKTEFLATMSHEVRTPLNGILPILEILRETQLDAEQRQFVNTALNSSHHLLSIINDILDYSKIEAGKLELETIDFDVREMIESVTVLMSKAAERRRINLSLRVANEVPKAMRGDPFRLRQILTNLVGNAIKFTARGSVQLDVSLRKSDRKSFELLFAVKDTGIGMSAETQSRLFNLFSQADASTTRKHGGTGLGLVICKRLTELMGGKIGIKSQEGKGSVFWVLVSMRKSLQDAPSARRDLQGVRALTVGCMADDFAKLQYQVKPWGVTLEAAQEFQDALNKLQASASLGSSWIYDLVIVDARALGPVAVSLVGEIRSQPALSSVAFMVLDAAETIKGQFAALNVTEYLNRPLQAVELRRRFNRILDVEDSAVSGSQDDSRPLLMPDAGHSWEDLQSNSPGVAAPEASDQEPVQSRIDKEPLVGRVLVVEDNPVNQGVVKKMLQRLGLQIGTADDGAKGVAALLQESFDLVLMDVQMPNMDGYAATQSIRQREQTQGLAHTPIIAMTANAMAGDREKCLAAGMDDYMSKPVRPLDLKSMLRRWLPMQEMLDPVQGISAPLPDEVAESPPQETTMMMGTQAQAETDPEALDRSAIEELFEIMEDEFVELLESYLNNAPTLMQNLDQAVQAEDPARLVDPAHSLKSSSANVGALKFSERMRRIEKMGREQNLNGLQQEYAAAKQSFAQAAQALQAICKKGGL